MPVFNRKGKPMKELCKSMTLSDSWKVIIHYEITLEYVKDMKDRRRGHGYQILCRKAMLIAEVQRKKTAYKYKEVKQLKHQLSQVHVHKR